MEKKEFIVKMLEYGAELDQSTNKVHINMIVNDAELLYDQHVKEILEK